MWRLAAASAALVAIAAPAAAQDTATPDGPATVRGNFLGPVTMEGRPHAILVRWRVTVGPGGRAGPVRLRVLGGRENAFVRSNGPREWLPAQPGTYEFPGTGVSYDTRNFGLALDQEVGGHVILSTVPSDGSGDLRRDPAEREVLDVFRPPLADDAQNAPYSERVKGRRMHIAVELEPDIDDDKLGDTTQDTGDLAVLRAWLGAPRADGQVLVRARVRNVGSTVRHIQQIKHPGLRAFCFAPCPGTPLPPGAEIELTRLLPAPAPARVEVESEGPDLNPADNTIDVTPNLDLRAKARTPASRGVTVSLATDVRGTALVAARIAGVRLAKPNAFPAAGRRAVRLAPRSRADRRRGNAALRRNRRVTAIVTAAMPRGAYATTRVTLRR
jgi:hypothetical protein